jgi:isoquinoline 1-oxidoreductase subunit alpha
MSILFTVNGERISTNLDPSTPLLWFLRDNLSLTGTKYGCGMALCGACTVHVNGEPARACSTPLSALAGKRVTTIEQVGKSPVGKRVQDAWLTEDVVQCGYCQSGQIMSAVALLAKNKAPNDAQIDAAMSGNICRCGTYNRVRAAIKVAAGGKPTSISAPSAPKSTTPKAVAPKAVAPKATAPKAATNNAKA